MNISAVRRTSNGAHIATVDGSDVGVPADPKNAHWRAIQAWVAAGGTITDPPAPTLAELKAAKIEAAAAILAGKIASGAMHGGHTYQLGPDKLGMSGIATITAKGAAAIACLSGHAVWPAGFAFVDKDNVAISMTAGEMLALSLAASAQVTSWRKQYWTLRAQISGAADLVALQAIDIAAGW